MAQPAAAESLDIEDEAGLLGYLEATGRVSAGERPRITVLAGGVSNRTVLVERASGEGWVIKQALAKLRVAVDWFSDPQRVRREALGLRWLERLVEPAALTPLVFEDLEHLLFAMRAVPQPHENWKAMLLRGELIPDHLEQFARLLGEIHREGARRRAELPADFEDRSYFTSLRLEPYYAYTAEQVPEAGAFLRALIDETLGFRLTLVHGDYSPKNVLVHQGRLVLLDHEVIHLGDPAFDLGFGLTHLLSKAHHLPERREAFAGAAGELWARYRATLGDVAWVDGLEARAVRHTLGCLLARVAGRSPLEYLDDAERERQHAAVLALLAEPPATVAGLARAFVGRLSS